ncbi:PXA domain-containing protein [Xylaria flabelliformis]|nr:PXA domain-containing protein [Xylaria flabelliformis]
MAATSAPIPSNGARGPLPDSLKAPATTSTASECVATTAADAKHSPSTSPSPSPIPSPSAQPGAASSSYSQPSSQTHRRPVRPASSEFLSDKATAALIRRTLCARHPADRERSSPTPIQDLLPPLTSRNDVDLQLYALISIILREYVQNWYSKITPDETFVAEIIQVIAHCTRALEQRLRKVDLESLLFDELPELFATHVRAYRIATSPTTKPPLQTDSHQIYHSLWPLPALSPVPRPNDQASIQAQADNESAYRQLLVHGVLAVLLPTEDLENECLTSLVGQILSELVIGNLVAGKLSQPWLIWELLIMVTRLIHKKKTSDDSDIIPEKTTKANDSNGIDNSAVKSTSSWSPQRIFWSFVNWVFLAAGVIRLIISTVALSRSLPPRPHQNAVCVVEATDYQQKKSQSLPPDDVARTQPTRIPVIEFHIWRCLGDILEVEARMPWLQATLSMMQWIALRSPGRVGALDGMLDRLMSHYIHVHVLDPTRLPPLLRAIRAALYPNNAPGVSSLKPPSSGEELAALRRRCASAFLGLVPRAVGELYYGTDNWAWFGVKANTITNEGVNLRTDPLKISSSIFKHNHATKLKGGTDAGPSHISPADENNPMMRGDATLCSRTQPKEPGEAPPRHDEEDKSRRLSEIETGIVDIFSDVYFNKHLIYGILELVLVRLVPELTEKGVGELWEERLH